MRREFIAGGRDAGKRVDLFLRGAMPDQSRAFLQKLIAGGKVTVNSQIPKSRRLLCAGDRVFIQFEPLPAELLPDPGVRIPVIFEGKDLLVIDKPAGIVAHPLKISGRGTLANWLVSRCTALRAVGDSPLRPGIVHRLDRWTSGLLLIAKSQPMFDYLKTLFKGRAVRKEYLAILEGNLESSEGTIEGYLAPGKRDYRRKQFATLPLSRGAKSSRTRFVVERRLKGVTLVRFFPETGRTHQLRVHATRLGHPILGDAVYGARRVLPERFGGRFFLHASRLAFALPDGRRVAFRAPLPADFREMLEALARERPMG